MIKSSNGEKFAICVFAFVINEAVKPTGNSIIYARVEGVPLYYMTQSYLIARTIVNRNIFNIAKAMNTPDIIAMSGKNACIAPVT